MAVTCVCVSWKENLGAFLKSRFYRRHSALDVHQNEFIIVPCTGSHQTVDFLARIFYVISCVCVFEQAFLVTKAALGEVGGEPARDKVPVHRQPCHTEVPDYRIHRNLVLLHRTVRRPPVSLAFISEVTKIASVSFSALRC